MYKARYSFRVKQVAPAKELFTKYESSYATDEKVRDKFEGLHYLRMMLTMIASQDTCSGIGELTTTCLRSNATTTWNIYSADVMKAI